MKWQSNDHTSNEEQSNETQSFTASSNDSAHDVRTDDKAENSRTTQLPQHSSATKSSFHECLPPMKELVTAIYIQLPGHGSEKQQVNVCLASWKRTFDAAYRSQLQLLRRENILNQLRDDEVAKQKFLREEQSISDKGDEEQVVDNSSTTDRDTSNLIQSKGGVLSPPPYWLPHFLANDAYYLERVLRIMYGWSAAPVPPQKCQQTVSFIDRNSDEAHASEVDDDMTRGKSSIVNTDVDPALRTSDDFRHSGAFDQEFEDGMLNMESNSTIRSHRAHTATPIPNTAQGSEGRTTGEGPTAMQENAAHAGETNTKDEAARPTMRPTDTLPEPVPAFPHANRPLYIVYDRTQEVWHLLDLHPVIALHRRQAGLQLQSREQDDNECGEEQGLDSNESNAETSELTGEENDTQEDEENARDKGVVYEERKDSDELTSELPDYDLRSMIELDVLTLAALLSPTMLRYCLLQPQAPSLLTVQKCIEQDADMGFSVLSTIATALHGIRTRDALRLPYRVPQLTLDYNIFFTNEFLLSTGPSRPMSCSEHHRRQVDNILSSCSAKARGTIQFLLRAGIVPSRPPLLRTLSTFESVLLALWLLMVVPQNIVCSWGAMADRLREQFRGGRYVENNYDYYGQESSVDRKSFIDGEEGSSMEDEVEDDAECDGRAVITSETALWRQLSREAANKVKRNVQNDGPPFLPASLLLTTVLELRRRLARDECGKAASKFALDYCLENLCLSAVLEDGALHGSDPLVTTQFLVSEPFSLPVATTRQTWMQHRLSKEGILNPPSAGLSTDETSTITHTMLNTCNTLMTTRHQRLYQSDLVLLLLALTDTVPSNPVVLQKLSSDPHTNVLLNASPATPTTISGNDSVTTVRRRSVDNQLKNALDPHLRIFAYLLGQKMQKWISPLKTLRSGTLRVLFSALPRFKQESLMRHLCDVAPLYELFGGNAQCPLPQLVRTWVSELQVNSAHNAGQQPGYIEIFAATFWHELHFRFAHGHYSTNEMNLIKTRMVTLLNRVEEYYNQYKRCLHLLGGEKCRYNAIHHNSSMLSNASRVSTGSKKEQHSSADNTLSISTKPSIPSLQYTKMEGEKFVRESHHSAESAVSATPTSQLEQARSGITLLCPDPYSVDLKKEMIRVGSVFSALPMAPRSYLIPETLYTLLFESEYIDLVAIRFLVTNNVITVRTDPFNGSEHLALEYAVMKCNKPVADLLVGLGMSLNTPVEGGHFTIETFAECQLDSQITKMLRNTWHANRSITASDPSKQYGILCAYRSEE